MYFDVLIIRKYPDSQLAELLYGERLKSDSDITENEVLPIIKSVVEKYDLSGDLSDRAIESLNKVKSCNTLPELNSILSILKFYNIELLVIKNINLEDDTEVSDLDLDAPKAYLFKKLPNSLDVNPLGEGWSIVFEEAVNLSVAMIELCKKLPVTTDYTSNTSYLDDIRFYETIAEKDQVSYYDNPIGTKHINALGFEGLYLLWQFL